MISIVIPVYNVKDYLDACLESVVAQTCSAFECLLVDDGSTDGSGAICDRWVSRDARIRVIHQPNQGVSAARNAGMQLAQGKYYTFIDSDDWVEPTYLQCLQEALEKDEADLAVCGLVREYADGTSEQQVPHTSSPITVRREEADSFVALNDKNLLYSPALKLYKKELIDALHLRFNETYSYGEDLLFNYQYLYKVKKIACVQTAGYHYRVFEKGSLSSTFRKDQFVVDYRQWQVLRAFYQQKDLWNEGSRVYLYRRLWGIVYDGLFRTPGKMPPSYAAVREILRIPEISELKAYSAVFSCAAWIKQLILRRQVLMFYLILKLLK